MASTRIVVDPFDTAVTRPGPSEGGRIGQNLVELGALTEEQLFDGLVEQFRVPTVTVDEDAVDRTLLERMPVDILEHGLIVPLSWNETVGVLSVAVANPSDEEGIERVRAAFVAKKVRVSLAPESLLADLAMRLVAGDGEARVEADSLRLVALPELFEPGDAAAHSAQDSVDSPAAQRRVVMVSSGASRKNFLPAVLRAEGYELVVVDVVEELAEALSVPPDQVLVSAEMEGTYREWVASGSIAPPGCEVNVFSSVGGTLLDSPAPYSSVSASVRAEAQAIAEYRAIAEGISPPYTLMATDVELVAERVGLGRLARDGMHVGLHLLAPVEAGTSIHPFRSFAATIELAHRIRFPWPVDTMLGHTLGLYLGRVELGDDEPADEVLLAAQVLSIVWFRHNLAGEQAEPDSDGAEGAARADDGGVAMRASLRALAGRFATLDVIEAYVEILAERERGDADVVDRRAMLVGGERVSRALGPALGRVGCAVNVVADGGTAQAGIEDVRPDAIVIDHQEFGSELEKVCRILRMDRGALVFVLTDEADPALVLNLLDIGVDDVFGPPHDFDLVAARVLRAVRARASAPAAEAPHGDFAARFEAFSFLDLVQMLANGMKSVRVDLRSGAGEEAVLYVQKGRPIRAECGTLAGPPAMYHVISWEDDGEFSVHEEDNFPEPNISESIESLLMEGVRLLDESRA